MGHLTRTPTSNDQHASSKGKKPWEPEDNFCALLNGNAFRCCTCRTPVLRAHLTIIDGKHAFCPDHKEEHKCKCEDKCQENIHFILEK